MDAFLEHAVANSTFQAELKLIRNKLWSHTVAVLVGSGFSRNADPDIPSWDSWACQLANCMDLAKNVKERIKAQDVPWLAGAYAARHGRAEMRDLLLKPMRDKSMFRTELHEHLICLPWVDIFTTNYDNFLEEAFKKSRTNGSLARQYNVVTTHSKLPLSRQEGFSRIVKLHGCLTNEDSCIITEEDYRSYRDKHGPFVNTIRQTLLENHLCLIGYSATDPDFLEWIGWVRDKLEGQHLKIYWLSKDQPSSDEKFIYQQRGITCIGLDCFSLSPATQTEDPEVHAGSSMVAMNVRAEDEKDSYYITYTNFLRWLGQGKEQNDFSSSLQSNINTQTETGEQSKQASSEVKTLSEHSGEKAAGSEANVDHDLAVTDNHLGEDEASGSWSYPSIDFNMHRDVLSWEELTKRMQQARENYPGWLLPPIKILRQLWSQHMGANSLMQQIKEMRCTVSERELLAPMREICWLLSMAYVPAFNELDKSLEDFLDAALPQIKTKKVDRPYADMWMACSLLLLRWAREQCDMLCFEKTAKNLEEVIQRFPSSEVLAALTYQRILLCLERFNRTDALRLVRNWKLSPSGAKIWFIRKAMLLGELGDIQQGYSLLKKQYEVLHSQVLAKNCSPESLSTARLAAESLRLFSVVADFSMPEKKRNRYKNIPKTFNDMLPPLMKSEPNISATLEKLQADVKSATAVAQIAPSKRLFEIGQRDNSQHFYNGLEPGLREAFQCSGAMESLGRSPYLGYVSFDISNWLGTAQLFFYLQRGINNDSLRLLFRSAPRDTFKGRQDIFLQYHLAVLKKKEIHKLSAQLYQELQAILAKAVPDQLDERYASFGLELLSRLSVRISLPEKQQEFLDWALEWMAQGAKWKQVGAFDKMSLFCQRIVESVSYSVLKQNLARILSSPVLMGFSTLVEAKHHFYFSSNNDIIAALPVVLSNVGTPGDLYNVAQMLWQELIKNETELQNSGLGDAQIEEVREYLLTRYFWRLLWMLEHDMVDASTRQSMGEYVWARYKQHGLPLLPGMRSFVILDWPVPRGINVERRYKASLLKQYIPPAYTLNEEGRQEYSGSYAAPLEEYLNIGSERRKRLKFTYKEKLEILQICYSNEFQDNGGSKRIEEYARRPLNSIIWILAYVFGGSLKKFEKDAPWLAKWIAQLINYGDSINARCQRLKVLNLLFEKSQAYAEKLTLELEEDLYSDDDNRQLEAGLAILLWRSEVETNSTSLSCCPEELRSAAFRGFWLMGGKLAASLARVLAEQLNYYQQLPVNDKEQRILVRSLEKKLRLLSYNENGRLYFSSGETDMNNWVGFKESLELLPEHRLAVGKVITAICKTSSKLRDAKIIQPWLEEMKSDPLSSMRREGEKAGFALLAKELSK